ncbi:MAG TPA: YlxR family protein [Amycolatopsis sp.]|uniref:YlxR family protein n=1 Tax=Amycolatopsis sp. TaxID=37632 RepID=UPI002B4A7D82|nr:YlxR family protein [Amycolatopsis sp.]HKS48534.1 YlxR family protein [Amycolatopsis sp.]
MAGRSRPGDARAGDGETPIRTCVGCRKRASAGELLRVVAMGGWLVVDERRRLPGRGAWLHPDPGCLARAERRRAFPRALRISGTLDGAGLRQQLDAAAARTMGGGPSPAQPERRKQVDPS